MCSQDSPNASGAYHIVYEYLNEDVATLLPNVAHADCNYYGASNGTCGWYGDWYLVFEDITFGALGTPPVISNYQTVKPRSVAGIPFPEIAPGAGSGMIGVTGGYTTVTSTQFTTAMIGSGITISDSVLTGPTVYTSITNVAGTVATLAFPYDATMLKSPDSASFGVVHNVYYEPHWYGNHWGIAAGDPSVGQLYFSSNRHLTWHDSVSAMATFSGTAPLVLGLTELTPEPASANSYSTTVFNEFGTPSPNYPTGEPFALYMSDAAHIGVSGCATTVPECSDLYICTLPGCQNQIPVVVPDFTETTAVYTATRFGWSPDFTHLASLLQHNGSTPVFYIWNLNYPTLEVTGNVQLNGNVQIK